MNKITWIGNRFECNNPDLETAKWQAMASSHLRLRDFMVCCDLRLDEFIYHADRSITILKFKEDLSFAKFPIAEEGTGFNVCFHLGAYAIASMNLGQKLEICAYSFKPLLHPVLFAGLSKWFGDRKAEEIDKKCPYYSGDYALKCAVNPSLPCKDCSDVSAGFNESLFVWKGAELGDRADSVFARLNNSDFGWADRAIEAHMFHPPINAERVMSRDLSVSFSVDTSQVQEAIARLREAGISERPFVGVDMGSGEDATAIATGFTTEDGLCLSMPLRLIPALRYLQTRSLEYKKL